ncbi:MAG: sensor histidine kinase [Pseudomonadota bacterium]
MVDAPHNAQVPRGYWALFFLAPVLFLALLVWLDAERPIDERHRITTARWVLADQLTPPPVNERWSPWTPLPVQLSTYPERSSIWYQLQLPDHVGESDMLALYSPHTRGNLTLFLDAVEIASGGSRTPPVAQHQGPLYFEFPTGLLASTDRMLIHRTAMDGRGSLPELFVGPADELQGNYVRQRLFEFWAPLAILIFMVVIISIMVVLFALRPGESTYFWYAATLTFWAGYQAWGLVTAPPFENPALWRAMSYIAIGAFVIMSVFFIHRFLGIRRPRIERGLIVALFLGSALFIGLALNRDMRYARFGLYVWIPLINLLGLYNVYRLLRSTLSSPIFERLCLLLITFVVVVVGIRDYVWDLSAIGATGYAIPGTTYYVPYAAGAVLIGFSMILMTRFARALETAESMNEQLSLKVAEKSEELEANYERLRQAERERTLTDERDRIMRDVHDGLGNQLVRLLSVAENAPQLREMAPGIRSALREVRLIVDSLAPNDGDLLAVLANFRSRVEKDLIRAGIRFRWQVSDVPLIEDLSPERVVNILRIVQESVTNTLKHSDATEIRVETAFDERSQTLTLCLQDNGCGITPGTERNHGGLNNMRERAARIDATLTIDGSDGTRVELRLPVTPRQQPD